MSEPFGAAVRAAAEAIEDCEYNPKYVARAILSAALPSNPAPETRQIMEKAIWGHCGDLETIQGAAIAAYRALRASLLPGEEPS